MASTSAAEPSSAMTESPNWLEMPHELMLNIFQRLPTVEILNSARKVCTTWLEICKYPAMWKVINIVNPEGPGRGSDSDLEALTKEAVDLSCGELIDIRIERFGTNTLLDYIVLRSNKLKRLRLFGCYCITVSGLSHTVKRVPQLEELHLTSVAISAEDIKVIGRNCPQLKSFRMSNVFMFSETYDHNAHAIANNMRELRHLDVNNDGEMTKVGLEAILNGCPHLQSLDVRGCFNLDVDGNLEKLCMERIKDFKHSSKENPKFHLQNFEVEDFSDDELYDDFSESDYLED